MTAFCNVNATDGSKSKSPTRNIEATVLAPPGNPTGLIGTPVGGNSTRINLNWTDNSTDETEFEVAYSTSLLSWTTTVTGVANNLGTAPFTLTGLQPATTYYITVRAIKAFDGTTPTCTYSDPNTPAPGLIPVPPGKTVSCWTNVAIINTNPALPQPVTNAIFTNIAPRTITINFTDNSTNELAFEILRSNGGAFVPLAIVQPIAGTGVRSYTDNTVLPNNNYQYRVRVFNVTGDAFPSATTIQTVTPYDPPIAPVDLQTFNRGLDFVSFFWINKSPVVDSYDVEFSANGINFIPLTTTPSNITTVTSTGLAEGTQYWYRVRARNNGGVSPYSNVIQPITLKRVAPLAPFALAAKTVSQTQIDLTWANGVEDGVTNVRVAHGIYRSSTSATEGFLQIKTLDPYFISYSDNTCKPKTKYWYKVVSANAQGESPFSNTVTATTLGPPFAPTNLAVALANDAIGNNVIKATWKDNSADEWGFSLERALDSTFTKEVLKADLDSNTIAATSIPIEEGLTYYFRVKASNKFGDSKYSNTSSLATIVTLVPNAPYGLKGAATAAEVALKWGDDSNNEATFEVERSDDGKTFAKIGATTRNEVAYTDKTVKEKTKYWYRVRATNVKGNSGYSNVVETTTLAKVSASIDLLVDNVFQVFPNPTSDGVKVTLSENMQKESGVIIITDRMNREVSKTILNENQAEYRLDLSNYSEGTYTISIRTNTQQITKRVYKY